MTDLFSTFQLAKTFRYLSLSFLCDATFTWFLLSWFVTRHVLFMLVIKSAYLDSYKFMPFDWDPAHEYYFTKEVLTAFIALMVALQVSALFFAMVDRTDR